MKQVGRFQVWVLSLYIFFFDFFYWLNKIKRRSYNYGQRLEDIVNLVGREFGEKEGEEGDFSVICNNIKLYSVFVVDIFQGDIKLYKGMEVWGLKGNFNQDLKLESGLFRLVVFEFNLKLGLFSRVSYRLFKG